MRAGPGRAGPGWAGLGWVGGGAGRFLPCCVAVSVIVVVVSVRCRAVVGARDRRLCARHRPLSVAVVSHVPGRRLRSRITPATFVCAAPTTRSTSPGPLWTYARPREVTGRGPKQSTLTVMPGLCSIVRGRVGQRICFGVTSSAPGHLWWWWWSQQRVKIVQCRSTGLTGVCLLISPPPPSFFL